ncbi:MAG: hypothetical protein ACKV2Q_36405 [Planctomycetaceae bacterium]
MQALAYIIMLGVAFWWDSQGRAAWREWRKPKPEPGWKRASDRYGYTHTKSGEFVPADLVRAVTQQSNPASLGALKGAGLGSSMMREWHAKRQMNQAAADAERRQHLAIRLRQAGPGDTVPHDPRDAEFMRQICDARSVNRELDAHERRERSKLMAAYHHNPNRELMAIVDLNRRDATLRGDRRASEFYQQVFDRLRNQL